MCNLLSYKQNNNNPVGNQSSDLNADQSKYIN